MPESLVQQLSRWIAYERDAAWAAKLAVLRVQGADAIAYLGACVREHDRHAEDLGALLRATDRGIPVPMEPSFVTRDAYVIGSVDDPAAILGALLELERGRTARYAETSSCDEALKAILARHLRDARARLDRLEALCACRGRLRQSAA